MKKNSKKYAKKLPTPIFSKRLVGILKKQNSLTLYSINPEYSKLIFSGKKKIELRKRLPKLRNRIIAVYETFPTKKVIGLCEISNYYELPIKEIDKFIGRAMIHKNFIFNYYQNNDKFTAIEIEKHYAFKKPISLEAFSKKDVATAPQSYSYITNFNLSLILTLL